MIEAAEIKRRIYGKLEGLGMKDEKENIVFSFTGGRTSHLSAMEDEELLSLLEKLGGHVTSTDNLRWGRFKIDNRSHRYILSLCQQLGWITYNQKLERNVADIARLGRWIEHFCQVKKPLMEQDAREVQHTIFQMEQMVAKHFKNRGK
jgi:hypothetical protein